MQQDIKKIKVLVTPDKFRGSLNATQVCKTVKEALQQYQNQCLTKNINFTVQQLQLADGGEGTLEVLLKHIPEVQKVQLTTNDPLFRPIKSFYLIDKANRIAYIEMAKTSGLSLLKLQQRNPLYTTTYGVGEIVKHALEHNVEKMFLFIGGSATNDAGVGMAEALGFKFLDRNGKILTHIGGQLNDIDQIIEPQTEILQKIAKTAIFVVSDVQNVFFGPNGAAFVYSPQKGANKQTVEKLDQGLMNLNKIFIKHYDVDLSNLKGTGAAGGLGGGALVFLKAKMQKGIQKIMDILSYDNRVENCDVLITGEGKLDRQSLEGKVVYGVLQRSKKYNKPLWILCGINELNQESQLLPLYKNISVLSLVDSQTTAQEAIVNAKILIKQRIKEKITNYLKSMI